MKIWRLIVQQFFVAHTKNLGYDFQLNIGYKAFAAFNTLNGVFIQFKASKS